MPLSSLKRSSSQIDSIQVLRGIAALLVVFLHGTDVLEKYHWPASIVSSLGKWGHFGVDIFFILSGFLMIVTTRNKEPGIKSAIEFMRARLRRIIPLYWALTTLLVIMLLLTPRIFNQTKFIASNVVSSYLFLPSINSLGTAYPVLYPGWTLIYEMFFYVSFAFLLCFTRRHIAFFMAIIFIFISLLGLWEYENIYLRTYTNSLILEFIIGCYVGAIYINKKAFSKKVAIAAVLGSMALLPLLDLYTSILPRFVSFGIPAALLVLGCLYIEKNSVWPRCQLLHCIGDSSYSLYLSHMFVLSFLGRLLSNIDSSRIVPGEIILLALVSCCALAGYATFRFVEKPLDQYLQKSTSNKVYSY